MAMALTPPLKIPRRENGMEVMASDGNDTHASPNSMCTKLTISQLPGGPVTSTALFMLVRSITPTPGPHSGV